MMTGWEGDVGRGMTIDDDTNDDDDDRVRRSYECVT